MVHILKLWQKKFNSYPGDPYDLCKTTITGGEKYLLFHLLISVAFFKKKVTCNKHFEINIVIVLQLILRYSKALQAEPYTICSHSDF